MRVGDVAFSAPTPASLPSGAFARTMPTGRQSVLPDKQALTRNGAEIVAQPTSSLIRTTGPWAYQDTLAYGHCSENHHKDAYDHDQADEKHNAHCAAKKFQHAPSSQLFYQAQTEANQQSSDGTLHHRNAPIVVVAVERSHRWPPFRVSHNRVICRPPDGLVVCRSRPYLNERPLRAAATGVLRQERMRSCHGLS